MAETENFRASLSDIAGIAQITLACLACDRKDAEIATLKDELQAQEDLVEVQAAIIKAHFIDNGTLRKRVAELEAAFAYLDDQDVLDGFVHLRQDREDYAMQIAEERGREEPTPEDKRDGFIRMVVEAERLEAPASAGEEE